MRRRLRKTTNLAAFLHIIDTSRLMKILRGDKTAILHAAAKAEQAVKWLRQFDPALTGELKEAA